MAKKMIYIRDADAPLFERAAELAGDENESLSATIAEALRRWIDQREAEAEGYQDYTLQPGAWPVGGLNGAPREDRPVKFVGRLLVEYCDGGRDDIRKNTWRIYVTRAGNIVVEDYHETRWEGEYDRRRVEIYAGLAGIIAFEAGEYHDPSGDAIEVPLGVIAEAQKALGEDPAIYVE